MAELADLLRSVADGVPPAIDGDLMVLAPPDERSVGVLAFAGANVVAADLPERWVRSWLPAGDLSAPLNPPFLTVLSAATGRVPENLDLVLVARANGRAKATDLSELTEERAARHVRVARARAHRTAVHAWSCHGGVLVLGQGVAGRWEVAVEVDAAVRGFGLGRGLFTAALGLLPAGESVWAQVAPGNAASLRAALAAGYRPVGAELLLVPDPVRAAVAADPFGWFAPPLGQNADDGGRSEFAVADPYPDVPDAVEPAGPDEATRSKRIDPTVTESYQSDTTEGMRTGYRWSGLDQE